MVAVNGVNEDKQALATGIQQIIDGKIAELVDMVRDNQRDIATLKIADHRCQSGTARTAGTARGWLVG